MRLAPSRGMDQRMEMMRLNKVDDGDNNNNDSSNNSNTEEATETTGTNVNTKKQGSRPVDDSSKSRH